MTKKLRKYRWQILLEKTALYLAVGICLLLTACTQASAVRHRSLSGLQNEEEYPAIPKDLRILHSASFEGGDNVSGQKAYVSVKDETEHAGAFKARLSIQLRKLGFIITDQPSRADRIIHVDILSRRSADAESLEQSVERGFGSQTGLRQGRSGALIADVLVVRRRVPSRDKSGLRNISARNAMSSSKIRFGLISPREKDLSGHSFEQLLAQSAAALAASDRDQTTHPTRNLYSSSSSGKDKNSATKKKKKKKTKKKKKN